MGWGQDNSSPLRSVFFGLVLCCVTGAACDTEREFHDPPKAWTRPDGQPIDLTPRFRADLDGTASESPVRRMQVTRKGVRRDAVVLVAPAEVFTSIAEGAGAVMLECSAVTVFNIGDGIRLKVEIVRADRTELVYNRLFEPGLQTQDREWSVLRIPLNLPGKGATHLRWTVSGGPRGDLTADWLALANVHIRRVGSSPGPADSL